jgi:hypothetical protein
VVTARATAPASAAAKHVRVALLLPDRAIISTSSGDGSSVGRIALASLGTEDRDHSDADRCLA